METRQQAVFFHPPGAVKRLFRLRVMVGDSAKPSFLPLGDTQGDLRAMADPAPHSLWLWETHLCSSPGHLFLGLSTGFGELANSSGHYLSFLGGDGGVDLGCQVSPDPGHVYPVEAEKPMLMIRAESSHWAKDKAPAPQAYGREGR